MKKIIIVLIAGLLSVSLAFAEKAPSGTDAVFINMADTHSAYDAYPRILTVLTEFADDNEGIPLFVLFDGDLFELGNATAARTGGKADWIFLERICSMAKVIVNIGNHVFDFMTPREFIEEAEKTGASIITTISDASSGKLLAPSSMTLSIDGRKIEVVGVATDQMNTYPKDLRESLQIPEPVAWAASNYADAVRGTDFSILLSHAGVVADRGIIASLPDDVLFTVGGHDHLVLREKVNDTVYMHNGFRGEMLNFVYVSLDSPEAVIGFNDVKITPDISADRDMERIIKANRTAALTAEDLEPVGVVPRDYTVLEAAMWSVETLRKEMNADAAFLNHTSFGSGLKKGPLPKYLFDQFMRFDNDVMVATVDGDTLKTILSVANQHRGTSLGDRTGDFVYSNDITPRAGRTYRIVTSSWVALPFNLMRYLNTTDVTFEKVEGVTTKQILSDALN